MYAVRGLDGVMRVSVRERVVLCRKFFAKVGCMDRGSGFFVFDGGLWGGRGDVVGGCGVTRLWGGVLVRYEG